MPFPKLSDQFRGERLTPPRGPVRIVLDTDTYNEVDDQFAVAYALLAPEALTVEGFDLTQVQTLIEGSDVSPLQKTMLLEGVKAAQDSPELLRAALEAARAALGY